MPDNSESAKLGGFTKLIELAYVVVVLCAFAWTKEFLLPIILAIFISFLLAPVVSRLERWGLHPILAALGIVALACGIIVALASTLSVQALDLVNSLPKYRDNIHAKWAAIQSGPPGPLNLAFSNISVLVDDLSKVSATDNATQQPAPTKVEIVGSPESVFKLIFNSVTPVLGPVAELAVVVVLVVFILLERKRFRNRFLRLTGHSHLATTTLAIDEAGSRITKFLLGQLLVNSGYALVLGIGLTLIGIPNAILWAVLTLVLRFLPYVGLWISASFPLILSVAISASWKEPILTLGLYVFLEVFTNNVVEPFVLGGSTGISPLAVIVSALFWTWLWGPIGLLLATPLTASLVVLGRYFSPLHFCSALLAESPPTSSETKLIRFLIENRLSEARALIFETGERHLTPVVAEELILPAIRAIENDLFPGSSASQRKSAIYEQIRALLEELPDPPRTDSEQPSEPKDLGLVIVPVIGEGDEVVGQVLARLLQAEGIGTSLLPWKTLRAEKVERLKESNANCIILSAVESRAAIVIGNMTRSIQDLIPDAMVCVGLWTLPREGAARLIRRITESSAKRVFTNLNEAVRAIVSLAFPASQERDSEDMHAHR
ncbi:MAG: AI-2E family transporter [Verrucomicrobia bacterium]|nr:AI-2E family transporter [Verrucomicrobiota bacterium]MBV9274022.1 AI-2E family transporter [Verrucomicrobiota bacterium]